MPKSRATESLTGGTGDVSPQFLSSFVTLSAANTYTEMTVPIPVQRISPQTPNSAIIVELLKIYINMPEIDATNAAETFYTARLQITTSSFSGMQPLSSSRVIMLAERPVHKAFTAAGTYETAYQDPQVIDVTDGAGHGVLVATDNLFLGALTAAYANAARWDIKFLYRWKRVALTEYIGIVQSQQ